MLASNVGDAAIEYSAYRLHGELALQDDGRDQESSTMVRKAKCKWHIPSSSESYINDEIVKNHDRCTASDLEHPSTKIKIAVILHRLTHSPHLAVTALEPSGWCAEAGVPGVLTDGLVANIRPNCRVSPRHC